MALLELDGFTLGEKHRHYNKLVDAALKSNQQLQPIIQSDEDIENLIKIDVACRQKNVQYILDVLKSEDYLYISKAIKRSTWLITDKQYDHVINPEYLHTTLYPQMTSTAFNKLMLHIRIHLKDEKRVEAFYDYIKEKSLKSAYKWLQNCSVIFIEKEITKHAQYIQEHIVQRLLKKSDSIILIYLNKIDLSKRWIKKPLLSKTNKDHALKFLDILDSKKRIWNLSLNATSTKTLMKSFSQRIINNFQFYGKHLDIVTFAKYLNRVANIEQFIIKYTCNYKEKILLTDSNIQHFIKLIPKEKRFKLIKQIINHEVKLMNNYITKYDNTDSDDDDVSVGKFNISMNVDYELLQCNSFYYDTNASHHLYSIKLYEFVPFDEAFTEISKLIQVSKRERNFNLIQEMLKVIVSSAGQNLQNINKILEYYYTKNISKAIEFKIEFINYFILKVDTHVLDDDSWNMLCQLFHSIDVFGESDINVQCCIEAIIIRNTIRNEDVPYVIENKFKFNTLKHFRNKLKTQNEKESVFEYLLNYLLGCLAYPIVHLTVEPMFYDAVIICKFLLELLKDWNKELKDYPFVLDITKELVKAKDQNNWRGNLVILYDTKKSWKKAMFEESILLHPSEQVFLNALKHDPGLLARYPKQLEEICCNDKVSLERLLSKIRIYWPYSIAEGWKGEYRKRINQSSGHKSLITGLTALLSKKQIRETILTFAPSKIKIDFENTDQRTYSLVKHIAKNVHRSRPLAPVEGILMYAKGDYLQYAVPSLHAILSQLSPDKIRLWIPILLDAPVSLQKFGVRYAFLKLNCNEIILTYSQVWKSTKNLSIRALLFTLTFKLMCNNLSTSHLTEIWNLLSFFIDHLTPDDSKHIYKNLSEVYKVPKSIRPQFYMKSYTFLCLLPKKCVSKSTLDQMKVDAKIYMDYFDEDFVTKIMLKKYIESLAEEDHDIYLNAGLVASFILLSKNDETQRRRFEITLGIIFEIFLPLVNKTDIVMKNLIPLLSNLELTNSLSCTIRNRMQIPLSVFETILTKLEDVLTYQEHYVMLMLWKLMVGYLKILKESAVVTAFYKDEKKDGETIGPEIENIIAAAHLQTIPSFTKLCVQYFKEDMNRFGSSKYCNLSVVLTRFFGVSTYFKVGTTCEYVISLLRYENELEFWLIVHRMLETFLFDNKHNLSDNDKIKIDDIRTITLAHPSDEIKVHFYALFADTPPFVSL